MQKLSRWQLCLRWMSIFFVAFIFSALYWWQEELLNIDIIYYLQMAKFVQAGQWDEIWGYRDFPFVPALIAALQNIIPDPIVAGRTLTVFTMSLILIPFYSMVRKIQTERAAWFAALFLAVCPYFRYISVFIGRESLFMLFFSVFVWCLVQIVLEPKIKWHIFAMMNLFLAGLFRIEGMILLFFYILGFLWRGLCSSHVWLRRIALIVLGIVLILTTIELTTPYGIITYIPRFKEFSDPIRNPQKFLDNLTIKKILVDLKEYQHEMPGGKIPNNLIETTRRYFFVVYLITMLVALVECAYFVMFILGILGCIVQYRRNDLVSKKLVRWMLLTLIPPYIFLLRENCMSNRYLLPAVFILMTWSGIGVTVLWQWMVTKWEKRRTKVDTTNLPVTPFTSPSPPVPDGVPADSSNQPMVLASATPLGCMVAPDPCHLYSGWKLKGLFILFFILFSMPAIRILQRQGEPSDPIKQAGSFLEIYTKDHPYFVTNEANLLFYAKKFINHLENNKRHPSPFGFSDSPQALLRRANKLQTPIIAIYDDKPWHELGEPVKIFEGKKKNVYIYHIK